MGVPSPALQVRSCLLGGSFDCLAVALPHSFQRAVEQGVDLLPMPTVATQQARRFPPPSWSPHGGADNEADISERRVSYVPIDPCQPVIAGLRIAIGEHIPREFIDLETEQFFPFTAPLPDAFALKQLPIEKFSAALLPFLPRPAPGQVTDRIQYMASRLRELERQYQSILVLCSILHWPWLREAYVERRPSVVQPSEVGPPELYQPDARTLLFMLGELPFITGLHERARTELESDEFLSVDGVKELLLAARESYVADFKGRTGRSRPISWPAC